MSGSERWRITPAQNGVDHRHHDGVGAGVRGRMIEAASFHGTRTGARPAACTACIIAGESANVAVLQVDADVVKRRRGERFGDNWVRPACPSLEEVATTPTAQPPSGVNSPAVDTRPVLDETHSSTDHKIDRGHGLNHDHGSPATSQWMPALTSSSKAYAIP